MSIVHGTYRSGHIELDAPVDWPEGARVEILATIGSNGREHNNEDFGMDERDWPTTKEGIEELIKRMDGREPVEYSAEDLERIEDSQKWFGDFTRKEVAKEMGLEP